MVVVVVVVVVVGRGEVGKNVGPRAVPKKRNLNQNIDYAKSHIWNSFFENSISGI